MKRKNDASGGSVKTVSAAIAYHPIIKAIAAAIGTGVSIIVLAESIYYYIKSQTHTGVRGSRKYIYAQNNDLILDWIFIPRSETQTYY